MKNKTLAAIIGGALMSVGSIAVAQTSTGPVKPQYEIPGGNKSTEDGPRGVALSDGVALYAKLGIDYGKDDNLFQSNILERSSNFYALRPGLKLQGRNASGIFTLDFDSNSTRYQSSHNDDFNDYNTRASAEFAAGSSMGFRLAGDYNKGHDARGSTDRPSGTRPDVFTDRGVGALFAYGANDAAGRVELEGGMFRKRYTNNRTFTVGSDRDTDKLAGRFFMRVAPKTSVLFEAREDKYDYALSTSIQDSKERRYLAGVTWEATAATSGTIKIGRIEKNFSSSLIKDFSDTGYEGSINWMPVSYSKFEVYALKTFNESTGYGDFALVKRFGANWLHDWNSKLSTTALIARSDDEYINTTRNDTVDTLGFKINYKLQRWLTLGGEYNYTDRSSNISVYSYKRNVYMLTLGATL